MQRKTSAAGVLQQAGPAVRGPADAALYEQDFPLWCDRQTAKLRRMAKTATGHDQPDWSRLIEEIESMGWAMRQQVESLLVQALVHLLKIRMARESPDIAHWTAEVRAFLRNAQNTYAPSMRRMIDVQDNYDQAVFQLTGRRGHTPNPLTLDDLLTPFPDVAALAARLPADPLNHPPAE